MPRSPMQGYRRPLPLDRVKNPLGPLSRIDSGDCGLTADGMAQICRRYQWQTSYVFLTGLDCEVLFSGLADRAAGCHICDRLPAI